MSPNEQQPSFAELLASTERTAVHLELRDAYGDNPRFAAWREGHRVDWDDRASWWHSFHEQIAQAVRRGVAIRRARVVSEPVSEYIRWEHYATHSNVAAGEEVRWLPRRLASGLLLPPNDYWVFDDRLARIHHFAGDGAHVGDELTSEPELIKRLSSAFTSVWEYAFPHDAYKI
ncbi:hypothetical protein AF335_03945 [Streptomyces eurocidicus]|uniref:DUF6879 domain-containing protein n=1 Tax=Streptomyces eurocidicus TaxID=66423 RepID=A0A2N8P395_STREU|nr:DUF6879 family protein [Streptomyces eurocidicus]MBB5117678.1 hypothetical protein [Streptomyces eurocidicus]MBF6053515.1 hypothetical protein [Streptomyces eurocidicus]PNE35487.1 hypothetical protein AF335_03945 [Streptomyces eurocidicus]